MILRSFLQASLPWLLLWSFRSGAGLADLEVELSPILTAAPGSQSQYTIRLLIRDHIHRIYFRLNFFSVRYKLKLDLLTNVLGEMGAFENQNK